MVKKFKARGIHTIAPMHSSGHLNEKISKALPKINKKGMQDGRQVKRVGSRSTQKHIDEPNKMSSPLESMYTHVESLGYNSNVTCANSSLLFLLSLCIDFYDAMPPSP